MEGEYITYVLTHAKTETETESINTKSEIHFKISGFRVWVQVQFDFLESKDSLILFCRKTTLASEL